MTEGFTGDSRDYVVTNYRSPNHTLPPGAAVDWGRRGTERVDLMLKSSMLQTHTNQVLGANRISVMKTTSAIHTILTNGIRNISV